MQTFQEYLQEQSSMVVKKAQVSFDPNTVDFSAIPSLSKFNGKQMVKMTVDEVEITKKTSTNWYGQIVMDDMVIPVVNYSYNKSSKMANIWWVDDKHPSAMGIVK